MEIGEEGGRGSRRQNFVVEGVRGEEMNQNNGKQLKL